MTARYRTSIVGLVDILGVSARLSDPTTAKRYAEAVAAILQPMIGDKGEHSFRLPHVDEPRKVEITLSPGFLKGSTISFISDSIVVSAPVEGPDERREKCSAILCCLEAVKALQRSLLMLGLRSRGGVAIGGLIHSGELVVGDGLVRAYDIERTQSVHPRTVVDPELIEHLLNAAEEHFPIYQNRVAHALRQDQDGRYFVDYLTFCPKDGYCGLEAEFSNILERLAADLKNDADRPWASKLEWLERYVSASHEECMSGKYERGGHADREFAHFFPRTNETLREYMASEHALTDVLKSDFPAEATNIDRSFPLWPLGWRSVMGAQQKSRVIAELEREIAVGHVLYDQRVLPLGRFEFSDEFLFHLDDGRVAQVHFTWTPESSPEWPFTTIHTSFFTWAKAWRRKARR